MKMKFIDYLEKESKLLNALSSYVAIWYSTKFGKNLFSYNEKIINSLERDWSSDVLLEDFSFKHRVVKSYDIDKFSISLSYFINEAQNSLSELREIIRKSNYSELEFDVQFCQDEVNFNNTKLILNKAKESITQLNDEYPHELLSNSLLNIEKSLSLIETKFDLKSQDFTKIINSIISQYV